MLGDTPGEEDGEKELERCSGAEYVHSCMLATPQPINLVLPCLYRKNYFSSLEFGLFHRDL